MPTKANVGDRRARLNHTMPKTHGEQVAAGVARAALLDHLLREPKVIAALDGLMPITEEPRLAETADRMSGTTSDLGLAWVGPWLSEFLVAAAGFRRTLAAEDLRSCALADQRLVAARAQVRSWRAEAAQSPWMRADPVLRLLAALVPTTEPTAWGSRPPDWIELFTVLVEQAAERVDWTSEATGIDRLWPYLLHSAFVSDVEPGDDPEVLHGLIGLWAARCRATIDSRTRARLPRGLVPDHSGSYKDGRLREGRRDKIRRNVSWFVDREIGHVALNDILRVAFPGSAAPLERSSEVRRHIREARELLAIELPLDAGQPLRLWKLAQVNRPLLESLLTDRG